MEVGPAEAALEGGKDEGAEDARSGRDSADEHERGGVHVERRFSKEDRRGRDGRETYVERRSAVKKRARCVAGDTDRLRGGTMLRGI